MESVVSLSKKRKKSELSSSPLSHHQFGNDDGDGDHIPHDDDDGDIDDEETGMFFGENPFAGSRVRQSGNMANDLFVKNRWMFGGIFGSGPKKVSNGTKRKEGGDDEGSPKKKKNKKSKKTKGNMLKKSNPALI